MTDEVEKQKTKPRLDDILTSEQRKKIHDKLIEIDALQPCPRCRNTNFVVTDGLFVNVLNNKPSHISISGQVIPSASVFCTKCGYISSHAIGTLGLMEFFSGENSEKK